MGSRNTRADEDPPQSTLREEGFAALVDDPLAATPRAPDGSLAIPFGSLYLSAVRP